MAIIRVRVTPGASETAIVGWQGDVLRIKVREKPQQGRANDAAARLLAKSLGVPPSAVTLVRGATARDKAFAIDELTDAEMKRRLGAAML